MRKSIKKITLSVFSFLLLWLCPAIIYAQIFKVDTILFNGPSEKRINLVYLGDGYTAGEMNKFINDVVDINNKMLNTFPLNRYKNYFNVFAIEVISPESGIKHARSASDCPDAFSHPVSNPKNYFGTQFDFAGIHRLVVPANSGLINSVLANNFPNYDQALIVANTDYYGGSGGTYATATTNGSAAEIMIHEIGHSFAFLADEYWVGSEFARERPNMTKENNPSSVRWKQWLNNTNIDIFPHSGDASWYKPSSGTCKMEALFRAFCSVCTENFIERIHSLTNPIETFSPDNKSPLPQNGNISFKVSNLVPTPNTLKSSWLLNGNIIAINTDSITLNTNDVNGNNQTVQYTVTDTTSFSRSDNHTQLHTYTILWNISSVTGIRQPSIIETAVGLYPNPSSEKLHVSFKVGQRSKVGLRLISAEGKIIHNERAQNYSEGNHQIHIDLDRLNINSGSYLLQLILNGNTITKQFIRIR